MIVASKPLHFLCVVIGSLIEFDSPDHSRPNGSESELRCRVASIEDTRLVHIPSVVVHVSDLFLQNLSAERGVVRPHVPISLSK
jgi:hypothetical protein